MISKAYIWRRVIRQKCLWVLLSLLATPLLGQSTNSFSPISPGKSPLNRLVLTDSSRFIAVGTHLSVLEDTTGELTFDQVRQRSHFYPSRSESFQYGFTSHAYWFRFQVVNNSLRNIDHWLIGLLDASSIDYVDFYLQYPDGRVEHHVGGLKRSYVDQGFFATTPFQRVRLPKDQVVTVYIRLASGLAMFGKVTLWEENYNLSKGRVIIFAIWMFLGLFILRSLNSFVLARFIPDRPFRFYTLCTFLFYLTTLSRTGVYSVLLSDFPRLLDWMNTGMGRLLPLALASWLYMLIGKHHAFRFIRYLLLGIIVLSSTGVFLSFYHQNASVNSFYAQLILLTYWLFLGCVVALWRVGSRPGLPYAVPIALCTIPFSLYQMQALNLIPYNPLISPMALGALAVEMISMSLVLGRIVQAYINDRITTANALMQEKMEVEKLQTLDGLKTRFFTNISHEFRTPLTLILAPIGDLRKRLPNEPLLNLMERNGQRLLNLITQLLDLTKLEAGQTPLTTSPNNMASFFRTIAYSFQSLADSREVTFTFQQDKDDYWAYIDRDKLEKITTNLLTNAFKFTPVGQQVIMQVRYEQSAQTGTVWLTIQDTGIGIADNHLPHIFKRFYQVDDDSASRLYEGTGIGLALVYELVQLVGGTITVTSQQNIGTMFMLRLPVELAPSNAESQEEPWPTAASWLTELAPAGVSTVTSLADDTRALLLIIDDSADIRAYVRSLFAQEYQIVEAENGLDGLDRVTRLLPDVVICDLMMPQLDGFQFCQQIKSQEATRHIPVVMLTARIGLEDRLEGLELGADDYVTKPFNQTELRVRVRNLVQQRQRLFHHVSMASAPLLVESPAEATLLAAEQEFIDRLHAIVLSRIDQSDFTVEMLAEAIHLSRVQLHRKLKALTGQTATEFIRTIRLTKAAELLESGHQSVTQVALGVGLDNLSYFAKIFQEQYGVPPSQYGRSQALMTRKQT